MKPALISGIQPTGRLHIGNYLGALKNFVSLQNSGDYRTLFFVADLHSLTIPFDPKDKRAQIEGIVRDYLAAGLSPKKSILFVQSDVPAHAELAWILNTITPMGELERMTQFKDKAETSPQNVNVGLLTYPVLMAADVLLYSAGAVPVGNDQDQHLELARTLARKFNGRFGQSFIEPKALHTPTPRVMSLNDPEKKMSKSSPTGCLFIDDAPEEIEKKIQRAVTDSERTIAYDPEHRPGISNLLELFAAVTDRPISQIVQEFEGKGYAEFKPALASAIIEELAPFQAKKKKIKDSEVKKVIAASAKSANKIANAKLKEVKKLVGII